MIDRPQAEALATFVTRVRPDWRHAGIVAAIEKVKDESATDVARALVNLAEDLTLKTPALLADRGGHWRKPDGVVPMRKGDHNVPCPDHPGNVMPCRRCTEGTRPPTPEELAVMRQTAKEAAERMAQQQREIEARRSKQ